MSLPNTLTINTGTEASPVDNELRRFRELSDSTTYIFPDHEVGAEKKLIVYRSPVKVSGNSRGTRKTRFKFSLAVEVPNLNGDGTIVLPQIIEVSSSFPVGCDADACASIRAAVVSFLQSAEAIKLQDLQEV